MKMMSLFDGSGGFPLAAFMCGIEPVYASEVEPYPIAVTRSRFPGMIHLGDVSKVRGGDLKPVDVITFGSPCQDVSIAGKRAGIKHEENGDEETTRSGLFMEAARIIREMREATNGMYPTFAVWENVPGAFSSNKGEDFRLALQTLVQIVEPEADVPGVPKGGWAYTTVVCMAHGQANAEVVENCAPCLNCNHEKPIVFDKEVYNSGINATGGHYISEGGPATTLRGGGTPPGVCIRHIVRRLIPTECARLQGFPDRWGDIEPLDVSDEAEVTLWREIYKTYCEINSVKVSASILCKPDRLKAWHDKLLTDSAEYKMWGNGIALPNALYVMQGIEEVMNRA